MSRLELTGPGRRAVARAGRRLRRVASRFWNDANGATAIEYVLVAGLVFLAVVAALRLYADRVTAMFNSIAATIAR